MKLAVIKGMSCEHCVKAVTGALAELGLKDISVNLESGEARFSEAQVSADAIREALEDIGFELERSE